MAVINISFGREICGQLPIAQQREWLVTNGKGGYGSGTVANVLTRGYHGLLVAALKPPLGRTLMLVKVDETVRYGDDTFELFSNRWASGAVAPEGYKHIENFRLEGTVPTWRFACADALIEKRIWMEPGANTTYLGYTMLTGTAALISLGAVVDYRDYHSRSRAGQWQADIASVPGGVRVTPFPGASPLYLRISSGNATVGGEWYTGFQLAEELYRGLQDVEDHLHAVTFQARLAVGQPLLLVASTEEAARPDSSALERRRHHEDELIRTWVATRPPGTADRAPNWVRQLVLAADQFIVDRATPQEPEGKTIIAGYHWFGDWGRDTMISLPGLTLATGRPEVAASILRTFARYTSQGMLPNRFPDAGEAPEYNTVDATLWYFQAIRAYHEATGDDALLRQLFPVLADIIAWHRRGTRFRIHLDPADGLLYAGEEGVQLTWMDARVGTWVVTPRIGKPVEVNALWYNALRAMAGWATRLGQPAGDYQELALAAHTGFARFWNEARGYCFDVLDGPGGHEDALRPNQVLAVSLPDSPLTTEQQRAVVEACGRALLASPGLRSLAPSHPAYRGHYGGDQRQRDSAYHQGLVWGWLKGPFIQAHLRVVGDRAQARFLLDPLVDLVNATGLGTVGEIFDGDAPMWPRGCIAQAWSVGEILRAWGLVEGEW